MYRVDVVRWTRWKKRTRLTKQTKQKRCPRNPQYHCKCAGFVRTPSKRGNGCRMHGSVLVRPGATVGRFRHNRCADWANESRSAGGTVLVHQIHYRCPGGRRVGSRMVEERLRWVGGDGGRLRRLWWCCRSAYARWAMWRGWHWLRMMVKMGWCVCGGRVRFGNTLATSSFHTQLVRPLQCTHTHTHTSTKSTNKKVQK